MKKFAIFYPPNEHPEFVEGDSAEVKRKSDKLKIIIRTAGKKNQVFDGVVMFCEVSEKIKVR